MIKNSKCNDGMHIFGELPSGEKRVEFIKSILEAIFIQNNTMNSKGEALPSEARQCIRYPNRGFLWSLSIKIKPKEESFRCIKWKEYRR